LGRGWTKRQRDRLQHELARDWRSQGNKIVWVEWRFGVGGRRCVSRAPSSSCVAGCGWVGPGGLVGWRWWGFVRPKVRPRVRQRVGGMDEVSCSGKPGAAAARLLGLSCEPRTLAQHGAGQPKRLMTCWCDVKMSGKLLMDWEVLSAWLSTGAHWGAGCLCRMLRPAGTALCSKHDLAERSHATMLQDESQKRQKIMSGFRGTHGEGGGRFLMTVRRG
jgi:hypothetical protein